MRALPPEGLMDHTANLLASPSHGLRAASSSSSSSVDPHA